MRWSHLSCAALLWVAPAWAQPGPEDADVATKTATDAGRARADDSPDPGASDATPRAVDVSSTTRVAVQVDLDLRFDTRRVRLFTNHLTAEIDKLEGVKTVSTPRAEMSVPQCRETDASCLDRIAEGRAAEELVTARTTVLADAEVLTLKRVRIRDGEVLAAVTRQITDGRGRELLLILGATMAELFPDHALRAGATRGVAAGAAAHFDPPPLRPWLFWSGVGLTAGAGVATLLATILGRQAENEFNELAASATTNPVEGAELRELEDRAAARYTGANILIVTTVSLAALTAVAWWLTDWDDDTMVLVPADGGGSVGFTARF